MKNVIKSSKQLFMNKSMNEDLQIESNLENRSNNTSKEP